MNSFPVLKINEMRKLVGKRVDVSDGWGGSIGVLSKANEDSICVAGFWYKIALLLRFQIDGKDYEHSRKIIIKSLWQEEYNSIDRKFFNARLNRFIYDFRVDATFDVAYDEWLNELNGNDEPYFLLEESRPSVARQMYKEQVVMRRERRFREFHNKLCSLNTLDEIIDEFAKYPHLFIIN